MPRPLKNFLPAIPLLFLAASPFYYESLGTLMERTLGPLTKWGTAHLLNAVGIIDTKQCVSGYSVGCLGVVAFIGTLGFFFAEEPKRFRARRWVVTLLIGVPYMLLLNAVRMSIARALTLYVHRSAEGLERAKTIGSYTGIPLYMIGIAMFFLVFFRQKRGNAVYGQNDSR
jgi:hypothetical protein